MFAQNELFEQLIGIKLHLSDVVALHTIYKLCVMCLYHFITYTYLYLALEDSKTFWIHTWESNGDLCVFMMFLKPSCETCQVQHHLGSLSIGFWRSIFLSKLHCKFNNNFCCTYFLLIKVCHVSEKSLSDTFLT